MTFQFYKNDLESRILNLLNVYGETDKLFPM